MQIFISYSSVDEDNVNLFDKDFQSIGINLIRDTRDLKPKGSIKEFMKKVRLTDYVVMVISDSFIKSYYCMYEVLEMLEEPKFKERLLPIILPNANIFNTDGHIDYIKYWEDKLESGNKNIKEIRDFSKIDGIIADLNHYNNIRNNIDQFISIIRDMKSWKISELREENYKSLLNYLGFKDLSNYTDILEIQSIVDPEEQEIHLHDFLDKNPNHKLGLFHKAFLAAEDKKYVIAINFYKRVLKLDDAYESAHFNLGLCYTKLNETENAKMHFKKVIALNATNSDAYLHLGICNISDLEKEKAEINFQKAIQIDEVNVEALRNLGVLYRDYNKDFDKAINTLLKANSLKSNNLAILLDLAYAYELSKQETLAYSHYQLAYHIDPHNQGIIQKLHQFQLKNAAYAKTQNEPDLRSSNDTESVKEKTIEETFLEIRSELFGTFLSSKEYEGITYVGVSYYSNGYPSFDSAKAIEGTEYVKVGDYVEKGQIVGQISAMTIFEIESEVEGYIVDKPSKDGPVEYGEVLFLVSPEIPKTITIKSPVTGTFHRSGILVNPGIYDYSGPKKYGTQGGKPYVEIGDYIQKGQVLCVLYAMVGYEFTSEVEGYIFKILVQDDRSIEYDQPLFEVIPKIEK